MDDIIEAIYVRQKLLKGLKDSEDGRVYSHEEAKALAQYYISEGKALHDLFCDWIWDFFTKIAEKNGEETYFAHVL
jgi:hypothetical protein